MDFAYTLLDGTRYRINLFRQQGQTGMVARHVADADLRSPSSICRRSSSGWRNCRAGW